MAQLNQLFVNGNAEIYGKLVNSNPVYPLGAECANMQTLVWAANSAVPATFGGSFWVMPSRNHDIVFFYLHIRPSVALTASKAYTLGTFRCGDTGHAPYGFAVSSANAMMVNWATPNNHYRSEVYIGTSTTGEQPAEVSVNMRCKDAQPANAYIVISGSFLSKLHSL